MDSLPVGGVVWVGGVVVRAGGSCRVRYDMQNRALQCVCVCVCVYVCMCVCVNV